MKALAGGGGGAWVRDPLALPAIAPSRRSSTHGTPRWWLIGVVLLIGVVPVSRTWDARAAAQVPFAQVPFAQGPFAQGPFAQGPFAQGPFAQGPFAQAPAVDGPLGDGPPLTAQAVEKSIERGLSFLKKRQQVDGGWPEFDGYSTGVSALSLLAMLNAGVPANDAAVVRAADYLRGDQPNKTYTISLHVLALCQLADPKDLPRIRQLVQRLEDSQQGDGGWFYNAGPGNTDASNSQFAVLALDAAEDAGIRVKEGVWEKCRGYWLDEGLHQKKLGAWRYQAREKVSRSMTCAGIASLIMIRGRLGNREASINGDRVECCRSEGPDSEEDPVQRGLTWLGRTFSVNSTASIDNDSRYFPLYYLYALERVGRLTGARLIGEHDWYREGCSALLRSQNLERGSWVEEGIHNGEVIGTSLALLFLSKGKRKIVFTRLEHVDEPMWNRHPEGLRQLTRTLERTWKQDLVWQTVRLRDASVADLMQSPVLVISGEGGITLNDSEVERLRAYLDGNGTLVFEAIAGSGCGDPRAFEQSAQELTNRLVGQPLARLPPDHPLWFAQREVAIDKLPEGCWIHGAQACCRTPVIYLPVAASCYWQLSDPRRQEKVPEVAAGQIDAMVAIGENIAAYATRRKLKDKLEGRGIVTPQSADAPQPRGTLLVPRVTLGAGEQDASKALPNLMEMIRTQVRARISSQPLDIGIDPVQLEQYPIVFLHGRQSFELNDTQRDAIRAFVDTGGALFADSICASQAFTDSFRGQWARIFPQSPLKPLPADHPLLTLPKGYNISRVTLRTAPGEDGKKAEARITVPPLEYAEADGRVIAVFSPYDLSCAMEYQTSMQCPGYDTGDAFKIGTNIILFFTQQ
jgi:hypothetical protein